MEELYHELCSDPEDEKIFAAVAKEMYDENKKKNQSIKTVPSQDTINDIQQAKIQEITNLFTPAFLQLEFRYQIEYQEQENLKKDLEKIYNSECLNLKDGFDFFTIAVTIHNHNIKKNFQTLFASLDKSDTFKIQFMQKIFNFYISDNANLNINNKDEKCERIKKRLKKVFKSKCLEIEDGFVFINIAREILESKIKENFKEIIGTDNPSLWFDVINKINIFSSNPWILERIIPCYKE